MSCYWLRWKKKSKKANGARNDQGEGGREGVAVSQVGLSRRRLWFLAAVATLLGIAATITFHLREFPRPRNFDLVTRGMTEEDVRAKLGTSRVGLIMPNRQPSGFHRLYADEIWEVDVYYDPEGRVEDVEALRRQTTLFQDALEFVRW